MPVNSDPASERGVLRAALGHRGRLRYTFVRRAAEPQIVIETVFWQ
ncbi:hypothetical protein [Streptomyces sp. NPDC048606]